MNKLKEIVKKIHQIDFSKENEIQDRLDNLTKPQGSLGRLEDLAKQMVFITGKANPSMENKVIFVMAGDHGITEEGVSAFPKEVTAQMVYNFIKGGAGINVLARHVGARVVVVDMGVASDLSYHPDLIIKKINYGTKNIAKGPAMTKKEAIKSIEQGMEIFELELMKGIDIAGIGEMGIGNTTAASAISSVITGLSVEYMTGKGTGIDDKALIKKTELIKKAVNVNKPNPEDAIDILSKVGGYEIGGLTGVILAAAANKVPVVIDGFISTAAALIAFKLEPKIKDYMVSSHCSVEKGHKSALGYLGLNPLFDFNLRLGEGTGSALGISVCDASVKLLTQMAIFKDVGVSEKL